MWQRRKGGEDEAAWPFFLPFVFGQLNHGNYKGVPASAAP